MAAKNEGVEKRPAQDAAETRVVGGVVPDEPVKVGAVADGVDDATRDRVVHDTTTRERTTNAKRAHEPLDPSLADENQPDEDHNGPRAAEVNAGEGPTEATSKATVSEAQLKAGREASDAGR